MLENDAFGAEPSLRTKTAGNTKPKSAPNAGALFTTDGKRPCPTLYKQLECVCFEGVTPEQIIQHLRQVKYPGFSRDIVSFGLVQSAAQEGDTARVSLELTTSDPKIPQHLRKEVENCLLALPGVTKAVVELSVKAAVTPGAAGQSDAKAAQGIQRAVAIASGKGGVGKSTFSVNLACALAARFEKEGRKGRVGLLDCDIYGPSVPLMMGLSGRPYVEGEGADAQIIPMERHGVKVMSMGFLIDDNTPVIWRGPMIMKTIQQFVQNVRWGELDILLVDLPPGTGDAQLSLVQTLPLDGAVLVTTPQPAATNVARKGGLMFQKVNVPLLGVAENMSYFIDPAGNRHNLFGEGGGIAIAEQLGTSLLGSVPILTEIRAGSDTGEPVVASQPTGPAAKAFSDIASALLARLASQKTPQE